jgi:GT2 family glycosyltransferase
VIVDNASGDGSADFARRAGFPAFLMQNSANAGFGPACNQGWRAAAGEQILFLNPDTECFPNSVTVLSQRLSQRQDFWAAGGRLLSRTGREQSGFNVRTFPSLNSTAAELLLLDEIWPRNQWTRHYRMADWDCRTAGEVDQPAAACLMVRRSCLDALQGFDERFIPAWFEDVDLCKRIRDAGGKIVFEPEARFLHYGGMSLRTLTKEEFLRCYHGNQILYFQKHHGAAVSARVRHLVIAGLRLRALLSVFRAAQRTAYWNAARHFACARRVET